jgi:copper chaperone
MKVFTFKTNMYSLDCIAKLTTFMEADEHVIKWNVNLEDPLKLLTVFGNHIEKEKIKEYVRVAGFEVEEVENPMENIPE